MKKYIVMSLSLMVLLLVGCSGTSPSGDNKFSYYKSRVLMRGFFKRSEEELSKLTPDEEVKRQEFYKKSKAEKHRISESEFNKFIEEVGITNPRLINILKVNNMFISKGLDKKVKKTLNEKVPGYNEETLALYVECKNENKKIENSSSSKEAKEIILKNLNKECNKEDKIIAKKYDNETSEILVKNFPETVRDLEKAQSIIRKLYPGIKE